MNERAEYLLQILDTIGSPLMSAITRAGDPDSGAAADAKSMASLLGKTVEASIDLGNIMDINPAEAQDDSLRVALAGLAGPLVAGQFEKRGDIPEAPQLKKMTTALQAVLTFSDNFTPNPETIERLKNLKAQGQVVDTYQTQIQYMQAFIPVIEVIAEFPFGQAEQKLIMDVSNKLVNRAVELRESLLPDVSDEAEQKRAELGLLKALAAVYSACHRQETAKVMKMSDDERAAGLSIDPVWKAFDTRAAMMETLAGSLVPGGSVTGGAKAPSAPVAEKPAEQAPQQQTETPPPTPPAAQTENPNPAAPQIFQKPPTDTAPVTPPEAPATPPPAPQTPPEGQQPPATPPPAAPPPQAPPAQQQASGHNPMSMFAKKPSEDSAPSEQAAPTPPPAPQAPPTPPPPPAEQPPVQTPPPEGQQPPQPPPQEQDEQGGSDEQGGQQGSGGGNPMSFFKKSD